MATPVSNTSGNNSKQQQWQQQSAAAVDTTASSSSGPPERPKTREISKSCFVCCRTSRLFFSSTREIEETARARDVRSSASPSRRLDGRSSFHRAPASAPVAGKRACVRVIILLREERPRSFHHHAYACTLQLTYPPLRVHTTAPLPRDHGLSAQWQETRRACCRDICEMLCPLH